MMKRIKNWFWNRFLPMWAKESLLADYRRLERAFDEQTVELERNASYIAGLEAALRHQRKIVIHTGEGKK